MMIVPQRALRCVTTAIVLASCAFAQAEGNSPGDATFSLDVEQVLLTLSVRDRAGRHVPMLEKDSFSVYEDGKRQQIQYFSREDVPVTVGLLVDNSRSMRAKHRQVLAAALTYIRESNPQDEMFVVNFNEHVRFGLPNSVEFAADPNVLRHALASVNLDGQTALYDAIDSALDHLDRGKWDKHVLLVISDGGDNASKLEFHTVLTRVEQSSALVYAIGVYDEANEERDPGALKKLSRVSGGEAYFPRRVEDTVDICEEIAVDIRSQYTIAYKSTNTAKDHSYRSIRVTARSPEGRNLVVRTRPGYYASQNGQ